MSSFAAKINSARQYAKSGGGEEMFESYRSALEWADNDSERLAALSDLVGHYERGISKQGWLKSAAVLLFGMTLIACIGVIAIFGMDVTTSRYGAIERTLNPWVLGWAVTILLSGLVTVMVLFRIGRAMDLLETMNLRQAAERLERKGVKPWTDEAEPPPA